MFGNTDSQFLMQRVGGCGGADTSEGIDFLDAYWTTVRRDHLGFEGFTAALILQLM
jgi:hypothetical protein